MMRAPAGMEWKPLTFFVGVSLLAGVVGSVATAPNIGTWYAGLEKPWFTPPGWVFGPAWTVLYLLMGYAAYEAWKTGKKAEPALKLFGAQLVLNALWSFVFFGAHELLLAFLELLVLWLAIAATALKFRELSRRAFLAMLPYLAWVTFAGALNFAVWLLN
jgi:benzodiazapine receptor